MNTLTLTFSPDLAGIEAAAKTIEQLKRAFDAPGVDDQTGSGVRSQNPGVALFRAAGQDSVTRRLLQLLPAERSEALTPAEIAAVLGPHPDGTPMKKGSARAAILNARRIEKRLKEQNVIDREIIRVDFDGYEAEHAGRYYLFPEDKEAIDQLA